MWLGIIGAVAMAAASALWSVLSVTISPDHVWVVHLIRLTVNAITGLVLGLLIIRLQRVSATDSLTQVYNRRYFTPQLDRHLALAKRHNTFLTVVLIDLDRFKEYNDTHGHLFGDRLLRDVAIHLQKVVRSTDIVARYGGDEFVILLPHTNSTGALKLMDRIKSSVCTRVLQDTSVSFSAGIASYPTDSDSTEGLLLKADQALYLAKDHRNTIQPYSAVASLSKD